MKKIKYFYNGELCQWYQSEMIENGVTFNCAEQYMMYWKARLFKDEYNKEQILKERVPTFIKRYGREIKNFNQEVWDYFKYEIVVRGNVLKFSQNEELYSYIKEYDEFVEASPYDKIWGVGLSENDPLIHDKSNWLGENLLGKAISEAKRRIQIR